MSGVSTTTCHATDIQVVKQLIWGAALSDQWEGTAWLPTLSLDLPVRFAVDEVVDWFADEG